MSLKDRISQNSNKRRLIVEQVETDSGGNIKSLVISGVERLDSNVLEEGTKLSSKSLLYALYNIKNEEIDLVDLVDIKNSEDKRISYLVTSNKNIEMNFNYEGPEIFADSLNSDYFNIDIINQRNICNIIFKPKPAIKEISVTTTNNIEITFKIKENKKIIKKTNITIIISPNSTYPID